MFLLCHTFATGKHFEPMYCFSILTQFIIPINISVRLICNQQLFNFLLCRRIAGLLFPLFLSLDVQLVARWLCTSNFCFLAIVLLVQYIYRHMACRTIFRLVDGNGFLFCGFLTIIKGSFMEFSKDLFRLIS